MKKILKEIEKLRSKPELSIREKEKLDRLYDDFDRRYKDEV